jgi:hypothetical protein
MNKTSENLGYIKYANIHNGSPRKRNEKGEDRLFEEMMSKMSQFDEKHI